METISKAQIKLIRSLQHKKYRDLLGLFVAEGEKCVSELRKVFEVEFLIHTHPLSADLSTYGNAKILSATDADIAQMSSLRTPQGLIGVFKQRINTTTNTIASTPDILLALDGVQDPGNLGTIIRTCDWFGVRHILCSLDTADCYNPKVVQATMGALARVHIHYTDLPTWLDTLNHNQPIYGTLLDGHNMYENKAIPTKKHGVIIMGNEGKGLSDTVRQHITHPLFIPSYPCNTETSESLNVAIATAVILAEFRRG